MAEAALRRILSIDGGGLRGVVALGFLEAIADRLAEEYGRPISLRDHFDLIGGTSTGAIIATALALDMPLGEIRDRYFNLAPEVFRRRWHTIDAVMPRFSAEALEAQIAAITAGHTLGSPALKPGNLAIITKRLDTGSVWFLTNNPAAPYWAGQDSIGNRDYSLTKVVLASAAAPFFFSPQAIEVVTGEPPGMFIDGSVTPHNNPALALLQIATIPAYGFGWTTGVDRLQIVSVGTGSMRGRVRRNLLGSFAAGHAMLSLHSMMADCDLQVLTLMQALGRTDAPWRINSEIGDLRGVCIAPEPLFRFSRYDVQLDTAWFRTQLGVEVSARQLRDYARIDSLTAMRPLYDLARKAAARQVTSVSAT